jgi:hypothetical protein
MIGQRGTSQANDGTPKGCPPIRYDAIWNCLQEVGKFAQSKGASVHCPKFGAGLAGGQWEIIEAIIEQVLVKKFGLAVTVYEPDVVI